MGLIEKDQFVCLDCETTGLDPKNDVIIELAAVIFTFTEIKERFETLIDPQKTIPEESIAIHNITQEMIKGKPTIGEVLPSFFSLIGNNTIVGHSISLDIAFLEEEAHRNSIPFPLSENRQIDTLRLARLYGQSPSNSLENLCTHFNIDFDDTHRAMSDVLINIEVFKKLTTSFKKTEHIFERLTKPILLPRMPLGKYKGRNFSDIPIEYLRWAVRQDFDQDLLFSIQTELKKRKRGNQFHQSANPFSSL